jgi:hypothetical protein
VASSQAKICSGTVASSGCSSGAVGHPDHLVGEGHDVLVAVLGDDDRARAAGPDLLDVGDHLVVQLVRALRAGHDDE